MTQIKVEQAEQFTVPRVIRADQLGTSDPEILIKSLRLHSFVTIYVTPPSV